MTLFSPSSFPVFRVELSIFCYGFFVNEWWQKFIYIFKNYCLVIKVPIGGAFQIPMSVRTRHKERNT